MQAINILRDDGAQQTTLDQRRQRAMTAVRYGLVKIFINDRFATPSFATHVG